MNLDVVSEIATRSRHEQIKPCFVLLSFFVSYKFVHVWLSRATEKDIGTEFPCVYFVNLCSNVF